MLPYTTLLVLLRTNVVKRVPQSKPDLLCVLTIPRLPLLKSVGCCAFCYRNPMQASVASNCSWICDIPKKPYGACCKIIAKCVLCGRQVALGLACHSVCL